MLKKDKKENIEEGSDLKNALQKILDDLDIDLSQLPEKHEGEEYRQTQSDKQEQAENPDNKE